MADRISTLPDAIICHILSFLPTQESAATSILSKRWNNLWLSVPVLDFCPIRIPDATANFRFNDFVYSIFISRDPALPIKRFSLYVINEYTNTTNLPLIPSFTKWLHYVLHRGVEYLNLHIGTSGWPVLPISIFTCRTLVVLKLSFFCVEYSFSSVELPLLKTLHLDFITFVEDLDFMLLLDGCPILENLYLSDVFYNYEDEDGDGDDSLISSNKWKNFSLSNLIVAEVDFSYFHFPFQALQNVRSLSIEIAEDHFQIDAIPTFHNLTHLDLTSLNYKWRILVEFLKHCPKLKNLRLDEGGMRETWTRKDDKESWVDLDSVPQCLSLHLKTFHLSRFLGLQGEVLLARYILENARVLQTMKIWTVGKPKLKMKRRLSSFPRASSTCELIFNRFYM